MPAFTDRKGQTWELVITFGHLEPLRGLGLDLGKQLVETPEGLASLYTIDPKVLVAATYLLCAEEIEEREVLPEKWAYLFDGPTVEGAMVALAEAVIGFFLSPATARRLTEQIVRPRPDSTSSASAGSSPATSASTPGP